jgi:predicted GNAT family acetyltransferase
MDDFNLGFFQKRLPMVGYSLRNGNGIGRALVQETCQHFDQRSGAGENLMNMPNVRNLTSFGPVCSDYYCKCIGVNELKLIFLM